MRLFYIFIAVLLFISAGCEELIENDNSDTNPPGEVILTTTAANESILLEWQKPDDFDFEFVRFEYDSQSVEVDRAETEHTLEGLTNGQEYTIKAISVDIYGNESDGVEVTATPEPTIGDIVFDAAVLSCLFDWAHGLTTTIDNIERLSCGTVNDLTGVDKLSYLKELSIEKADFDDNDIAFLSGLDLEELSVGQTELSNLNALSVFPNLKTLNVSGSSNLSDITGLTALTELLAFYAENCDITSLPSPMPVNLIELDLGANGISDISNLSTLTSLTSINIMNNNVTSLNGLQNATGLTNVIAHYNNISDISAISGAVDLWQLSLSQNSVVDISAIQNFNELFSLDLEGNSVSDLNAVATLLANGGFYENADIDLSHNNLTINFDTMDANATVISDLISAGHSADYTSNDYGGGTDNTVTGSP